MHYNFLFWPKKRAWSVFERLLCEQAKIGNGACVLAMAFLRETANPFRCVRFSQLNLQREAHNKRKRARREGFF